MTDADYKKTLADRSELEDVLNEELKIERQLRKLRARSEALGKASQCLARLVGEDREEESIGITDAIRKILRDAIFGNRQPLGFISKGKSFRSKNTETHSP